MTKVEKEVARALHELELIKRTLSPSQLEELKNYEVGSVFVQLSTARMMKEGTY